MSFNLTKRFFFTFAITLLFASSYSIFTQVPQQRIYSMIHISNNFQSQYTLFAFYHDLTKLKRSTDLKEDYRKYLLPTSVKSRSKPDSSCQPEQLWINTMNIDDRYLWSPSQQVLNLTWILHFNCTKFVPWHSAVWFIYKLKQLCGYRYIAIKILIQINLLDTHLNLL